mmetsp:Transcript_18027/g.41553  ORF Transcript_18027/g.41553 Transcript_18027/m.41553 type:complete len:208 (+) Transcript_18027:236-859(+)
MTRSKGGGGSAAARVVGFRRFRRSRAVRSRTPLRSISSSRDEDVHPGNPSQSTVTEGSSEPPPSSSSSPLAAGPMDDDRSSSASRRCFPYGCSSRSGGDVPAVRLSPKQKTCFERSATDDPPPSRSLSGADGFMASDARSAVPPDNNNKKTAVGRERVHHRAAVRKDGRAIGMAAKEADDDDSEAVAFDGFALAAAFEMGFDAQRDR